MLYSSGTTGRPKGVLPVVAPQPIDADNPLNTITRGLYGMDANTIYLSPAPLYHAAPLRFNMSVMRLGGTSVIMENFDAEEFLRLVPNVPCHPHPARADDVRAHPQAARRGAPEIRRVLAALRDPRRRALPHPGERAR